jgi:hypothetical protein
MIKYFSFCAERSGDRATYCKVAQNLLDTRCSTTENFFRLYEKKIVYVSFPERLNVSMYKKSFKYFIKSINIKYLKVFYLPIDAQ